MSAEVIGKGVRFRSVAASSSGDPRQSYSSLGGSNLLPSEPTPLSLYKRLFGPGFQDPTKGDWKPQYSQEENLQDHWSKAMREDLPPVPLFTEPADFLPDDLKAAISKAFTESPTKDKAAFDRLSDGQKKGFHPATTKDWDGTIDLIKFVDNLRKKKAS